MRVLCGPGCGGRSATARGFAALVEPIASKARGVSRLGTMWPISSLHEMVNIDHCLHHAERQIDVQVNMQDPAWGSLWMPFCEGTRSNWF